MFIILVYIGLVLCFLTAGVVVLYVWALLRAAHKPTPTPGDSDE